MAIVKHMTLFHITKITGMFVLRILMLHVKMFYCHLIALQMATSLLKLLRNHIVTKLMWSC